MIVQVARHMQLVVTLSVLASLAIAAAPVAWHMGGYSDALPPPADRTASVATAIAPADIGPVLALGPFGEVFVEAADTGPVGETTLDLVLRGVVVQQDEALSSAFISTGSRTQSFRPGDAVTEAASLISVAPTQVVLEVDGELQTLSFPEPGDAPGPVDAPAATGLDRLRAAVGDQTAAGGDGGAPRTTDDYISLWRDRITANPAEVLDAIGLIPTENGYMIDEQHDSGVRRAGLRAGDLVKSVNGQAVGDVEQDRKLYDDVAASGLARIEVERDGRTIVMSFPLR